MHTKLRFFLLIRAELVFFYTYLCYICKHIHNIIRNITDMRFRKTRKILFSFICSIAFLSCNGPETKTCYLSGTDKDHTVDWQFYCSDGMNSGQWTTIAVPSCWELQGFGGYNYGIDGGNIHREQGHYKHSFSADKA